MTTTIGVRGGTHTLGACNIVQPKQIPKNKTNKNPINYKKAKTNPKTNSQTNPKNQPQNIKIVGDINQGKSNDKIDKITNVNSGKLTQTSILTFVKKGVKIKGETQLAPQ